MEGAGRIRIVTAAAVVSLAIGTSFITSTIVASRAYLKRAEEHSKNARTLDVTGSARKRITSDLALWSIRVSGEGKTLEDAFPLLDAAVDKVRAFLEARGFPADSVALGPIHTASHFRRDEQGYATRELLSCELSRTFSVRHADVGMVAKATGEVTELLQGGTRVQSSAPEYIFTKLADLKIEMLGLATANARERAERIASESRCRLGAVSDARAGVLQITPPWSTEVSGSGMNDTTSIEKDITSVVHLSMQIEPM